MPKTIPGPNVLRLPRTDALAKVMPLLQDAIQNGWHAARLSREAGVTPPVAGRALKAYQADLQGIDLAETAKDQFSTSPVKNKGNNSADNQANTGKDSQNKSGHRGDSDDDKDDSGGNRQGDICSAIEAKLAAIPDPVARYEALQAWAILQATEDLPSVRTVSDYDKLMLTIRRSLDMKDGTNQAGLIQLNVVSGSGTEPKQVEGHVSEPKELEG